MVNRRWFWQRGFRCVHYCHALRHVIVLLWRALVWCRFAVEVGWLGDLSAAQVLEHLQAAKQAHGNR